MWRHDRNQYRADVVAVFDNQDDADEAVLQLRMAGFDDGHIGYFSRHQFGGWAALIERDHGFAGAVVGGIVGMVLGVGVAWPLNLWSMQERNVSDFFGLAVTCGVFAALFAGLVGWGIGESFHRRGVETPAVDQSVGPFVVEVATGDDVMRRDRAWSVIHAHGGHELPPGAMAARPIRA